MKLRILGIFLRGRGAKFKFAPGRQLPSLRHCSSANLKLQKFTLKINSILDKGLCNFYKLIEIFEALFYSISFKKWKKL